MRLAKEPPTTQSGRIFALEDRLDKIEPRLVGIETTLGEVHTLLVNARGFKKVVDAIFKYFGQISMTCGALYGAWRFFSGH